MNIFGVRGRNRKVKRRVHSSFFLYSNPLAMTLPYNLLGKERKNPPKWFTCQLYFMSTQHKKKYEKSFKELSLLVAERKRRRVDSENSEMISRRRPVMRHLNSCRKAYCEALRSTVFLFLCISASSSSSSMVFQRHWPSLWQTVNQPPDSEEHPRRQSFSSVVMVERCDIYLGGN